MKILEDEFTGAIQKFCEILCKKSKEDECHYYKHFNNLMANVVGTNDIKEETLFNTQEYAIAIAVKKFTIEQIKVHINRKTDKDEAYRLIKNEVQEKADELKANSDFFNRSPTIVGDIE